MGKYFDRVVLTRLQVLANRIYPESHCGFRAERSTVDMIFSVRQLQEKCREQQIPLYIAFIDLTKAFDLLSRRVPFPFLKKIGCPPPADTQHYCLYSRRRAGNSQLRRCIIRALQDPGKQGCVRAPTLFGIFYSMLLNFAFRHSDDGVHLHTKSEGKLFNLARLKGMTEDRTVLNKEMLFADDAALTSHTEEGLKQLISKLAYAAINQSINQHQEDQRHGLGRPSFNGEVPEVTDSFTYLRFTIKNNLSLDAEIDTHIAKAAAVMSKLSKRVWENHRLTLNTKHKVYQASVLSTLLYGSESWTTYARQENRLESFHLRCLRRMMGIRWQDTVTITAVLEKAGSFSMHLILCQRRLRWLGHVHRMEDGRIPASLGMPRAGSPALSYKGVCKRDLKLTDINPDSWEKHADDTSSVMLYVMVPGEERIRGNSSWRINGQKIKRDSKPWTLTSHPPLCATSVDYIGLQHWTAGPHTALLSTERLIQPGAHHCLPRLKDAYLFIYCQKGVFGPKCVLHHFVLNLALLILLDKICCGNDDFGAFSLICAFCTHYGKRTFHQKRRFWSDCYKQASFNKK